MLILAVIDPLPPSRRVLRGAALDHVLAACFAVVLSAAAAAFVLLRPQHHVLGIAPESILLLVVYLAGVRAVYRHRVRKGERASADSEPSGGVSLRRAGPNSASRHWRSSLLLCSLPEPQRSLRTPGGKRPP